MQPSAVPGQAAVRADDPVARQHDRHRVAVHHRPDRPCCARVARTGGELAVRRRLAVADARELGQDAEIEVRLRAQVELDVEAAPAAVEIFLQLAADTVDRTRRAEDARPVQAGQHLELLLGIGIEADAAQAAVGDADEQRPDGDVVEDVVGDVEQALCGGGRAKALVELEGRNLRHWFCSFLLSRRRRTPADAAWRAADSVEPSAAPISS